MQDKGRWPVVAVPARNEAARLPALCATLASQTWLNGGHRLPVTVVLNNGSDASLGVMQEMAVAYPALDIEVLDVVFPSPHDHVGSARRLAMDRALSRAGDPSRTVVLTTDADGRPDPGWVSGVLAAVDAGADLVGGQIIGDAAEEHRLGPGFQRRASLQKQHDHLADVLAALVDPLDYDPLPRHRDHTGASLAVRGDVYTALDGLPPLPFREDLAFVGLARAAGYRLVHPPGVRVTVSARLDGRAKGGMADCLRSWLKDEADGRPQMTEDPDTLHERLRRRRAIRLKGGDDCAAVIERLAADDPDAPGDVEITRAIARLELLIAEEQGLSRAA